MGLNQRNDHGAITLETANGKVLQSEAINNFDKYYLEW